MLVTRGAFEGSARGTPLLAAVCNGVTICVTAVTLLRLKDKHKPSNWMLHSNRPDPSK